MLVIGRDLRGSDTAYALSREAPPINSTGCEPHSEAAMATGTSRVEVRMSALVVRTCIVFSREVRDLMEKKIREWVAEQHVVIEP